MNDYYRLMDANQFVTRFCVLVTVWKDDCVCIVATWRSYTLKVSFSESTDCSKDFHMNCFNFCQNITWPLYTVFFRNGWTHVLLTQKRQSTGSSVSLKTWVCGKTVSCRLKSRHNLNVSLFQFEKKRIWLYPRLKIFKTITQLVGISDEQVAIKTAG